MADGMRCPRCGSGLLRRSEDGLVECPRCRVAWEAETEGDDAAIIEVVATPVPHSEGDVQVPPRIEKRRPLGPEAELRRFEVRHYGGGGCCLAGCLLVFVLVYLIYRGLLSLF